MEYIQSTLFGKMYPELSVAGGGTTSEKCSTNSSELSSRTLPMCLCLKRGGQNQEYYWVPTGRLLGELMMRNSGECPNEEKESLLSSILEDNPHQKYCLSQKACQGILNRAKRREKDLPERLRIALELQAGLSKPTEARGYS